MEPTLLNSMHTALNNTNMINANSYSSKAIRVELTGYDIPGATLRAPFEGHAVSTLKMCLLCQGINASRP